MHRTAPAALALSGLLLVSACGSGGDKASGTSAKQAATPPGATVHLTFTLIKPTSVTLKAGQALTFVNDNPIGHVMVEGSWKADPSTGLRTDEHDDGTYSLKLDKSGQTASHTYDKAGRYQFFCTIHKGMNGTVTVT